MGAVQVFNLDTKAKVASIAVDFDIIFWTWTDSETIVMVSSDFIYKWSYSIPDAQPEPWFEKGESLDECQIINVQVDHSNRWCLVTGIQLKVR